MAALGMYLVRLESMAGYSSQEEPLHRWGMEGRLKGLTGSLQLDNGKK